MRCYSLLLMLWVAAVGGDSTQTADAGGEKPHEEKRKVLHSIQRRLEDYSDAAIRQMISTPLLDEQTETSMERSSERFGMMRVRADVKSSSIEEEERPSSRRHHRSARHGTPDWSHHKRRRKGCPPLHGKDQLLCPSRNSHRYDVCISREQLCDHIIDCPEGEDEDPKQCFFYKPLDDQLKTLSHAVLLLVDNVMSEAKNRRNEL